MFKAVNEYKQAYLKIRAFLHSIIEKRFKEIESPNFVQNDMLSTILTQHSKSFWAMFKYLSSK